MRNRHRSIVAAGAFSLVFGIAALNGSTAGAANAHASARAVCPTPRFGSARCHALVVTDAAGNAVAATTPNGYGPAQFHGAYSLPTAAPNAQTIAIVDAFDDPTAKADLDTFDSTFGLPFFPWCGGPVTTACFQKVNQSGQAKPLPRKDAGWALEISLDVQVVHGVRVAARRGRRCGRRRSEDRRCGVRLDALPGSHGLVPGRRHQPGGSDDRGRVRARGERQDRVVPGVHPVRPHVEPARRHD